tara:strand:+ start:590 stop:724 length:135 start_codon:yes stop_codon:yes gene_type:complete
MLTVVKDVLHGAVLGVRATYAAYTLNPAAFVVGVACGAITVSLW